jgi:HAD superfamily hydrolase (TIGR01484 family)
LAGFDSSGRFFALGIVMRSYGNRDGVSRDLTAWLFDIDGVIVDPESKMLRHLQILVEIERRMLRGEPVGANTGRSLEIAVQSFLDPLATYLEDNTLLENVTVIGEKGGTQLIHLGEGQFEEIIDESLANAIPLALRDDVASIVADRFSDFAFLDETKQTMITLEMKNATTLVEFAAVQPTIVRALLDIVREHNLEHQIRVDPTRIAVDIESRRAGKALGAQRFIEFLSTRELTPHQIIAFGDSPSDYDMASYLHVRGFDVTFVFVGGRDYLGAKHNDAFPVVFTQCLYDLGTLEYLSRS